jgi:hypothetical protein
MTEFRLCYIDGNFAYLTTQELSKQWGDDWNDAPYEHNAGTPYRPSPCQFGRQGKDCQCESCQREWNNDGTPKWDIKKIVFEGPFIQPSDNYCNSPYSVEMINNGAVAWLRTDGWTKEFVAIGAGTTLQEFIAKVKQAGGEIYLPITAGKG